MTGAGRRPGDQPLACDRSALDPAQRGRHEALWKRVDELSDGPEATDHGVAFKMPRDPYLARELGELALLEQVCCPFLGISVTFEPHGGPLVLELIGDGGMKEFLGEELPLS